MNTSLYLSQSYSDAWSDYERSKRSESFPTWDVVILTAGDEHQAEGFRTQIEDRRSILPSRTVFAVLPDEGGVRVGNGAAVISFKEDVETGKEHGVYLRGNDGNVRSFLHKQTVDTLRSVGAVNEHNCEDIDTGAILMGTDMLDSMAALISTDGAVDEEKYHAFVNNEVRLSLYGDFQYPLATDSTFEQFLREKPEREYSDALTTCRKAVWEVLRPFRLKLLPRLKAVFADTDINVWNCTFV